MSSPKTLDRYGVSFVEGILPLDEDGSARVDLGSGATLKRIFLLGMVHTGKPRAWPDPRNQSVRYFVGDEIGRIRLDYADGSNEVFPLILGESIWWGHLFSLNPEPFPASAELRKSLAASLRLFPPAPVPDGNYVASITPRPFPLRSITVEDSPAKKGVPVLAGITVEPEEGSIISGAMPLSPGVFSPDFARFVETMALRPIGQDEAVARSRREDLRRALYTSDENFAGKVAIEMPSSYSGPNVSFQGDIFADILTNAFHHNVHDMLAKIGEDGTYHTSTKGSLSWGGYNGFGTYREDVGPYYNESYARDLGRSLQELTHLGYTTEATRCADFCLRMARLWEVKPSLKIDGIFVPRHWCRVINRPGVGGCFENDGHGLISLFLFQLWQRLPDRDVWLRSRWVDVAAAGDWILWQFDHPEISGAKEVLHTTGESASRSGYTVYADFLCMEALLGLAQMADSIGEIQAAGRWRGRAAKMKEGIASSYILADPVYGRIWTLESAGWTHHSTVLGPLICLPDYKGFAPEDDDFGFRSVNEAAYQRLLDTYRPLGFYGQAMGYGQGFVTQAALLLDRMRDATKMLEWTAKQIYDPRFGSFIVPEGCEIEPTGRFWYRVGDLGNGVQEAEIIKALRLVIGVDDTQPGRLRLFPRIPYGWEALAVEKYPVVFESSGKVEIALLRFKLERSMDRIKLEISSDKDLEAVDIRLGPFEKQHKQPRLRINGKAHEAFNQYSGDSWWVRFTAPIGAATGIVEFGEKV